MGLFDVGGKFKPRFVAGVKNSRFIEPHGCEDIADYRIKYRNAEKLAEDIGDLPVNFRAFVLLDGSFIFGDFIEALIVIISHFYFANERAGLMPYMYNKLDIDNKFQVAVASVHTKIAMIKTSCGKKITIHGSANMRTSSNIEQIVIEHTPDLFDFCAEVHHSIIDRHKTINKPVRRSDLWRAVLMEAGKNPECPTTGKTKQQHRVELRSAFKAGA